MFYAKKVTKLPDLTVPTYPTVPVCSSSILSGKTAEQSCESDPFFLGVLKRPLRPFPVKIADLIKPVVCTADSSVADPGLGRCFFGPGIWDENNPNPESGINTPDHIFKSLVKMFSLKILKFFVADPDPGSGDLGSGMEKFGSRINIEDPQHWLTVFLKFSYVQGSHAELETEKNP